MKDSKRAIATSARHFFSGTALSRLTGLGREVSMAALFGTLPAVAAFWMAFRFAHLLRRLFGEGALHTAFIPHYEQLRTDDPKRGARFFYDLSMTLSLLLFAIVVIAEGILGGFLLFGELGSGKEEVVRLTMILLPAAVFISLFALNTSLLNCDGSYFLPSVAPAALNLLWIGALFFVYHLDPSLAMQRLAMIVVGGFALQWALTLPSVYRHWMRHRAYEAPPIAIRALGKILAPFLLGMLGVAAVQINTACDALFARAADPQGPALLWYALRLQQLPLALFGVAIASALFPPISRAIERQAYGEYHTFLRYAFERALMWMIPLAIGCAVLAFPAVNLVYGHGAFSMSAAHQTAWCLIAYGIALVPMTVVMLFAAAFYAIKNYKTPALFSCFCVALNCALNALFVFYFQWGALSIALATTLSSFVNAALLIWILSVIQKIEWKGIGDLSAKLLISSSLAACATYFASRYLPHSSREISTQLAVFLSEAAVYGVLFLMCAKGLNLPFPSAKSAAKKKHRKA